MVYAVSLIVILITIYRCATIGTPAALKNYIMQNEQIDAAYKELKENFVMYKLETRNPFSMGDAFFIDSAYYLESAKNLQLVIRCKTSRFGDFLELFSGDSSLSPFVVYLKISETSDDVGDTAKEETVVIEEAAKEESYGSYKDSYMYYIYSFDGVEMDYAKTRLELFVFDNSLDAKAPFDEEGYIARFTLFDVNTPKTKLQAAKFMPPG